MLKYCVILFFGGSELFLLATPEKVPHVKRVMVVAPHPDDEVLGCGGAIIQHVKTGAEVCIVYMTSGEAGQPRMESDRLGKVREEEAQNSAGKLGVSRLFFLREPDGKLHNHGILQEKILNILYEYKPELIYIPNQFDGHQDHVATHNIIKEAVAKAVLQVTLIRPFILGYEVWTPIRSLSYVVDISGVIEQKMAALAEHKTQIINFDFVEAIKGLNRYRGIMHARRKYAEFFEKVELFDSGSSWPKLEK